MCWPSWETMRTCTDKKKIYIQKFQQPVLPFPCICPIYENLMHACSLTTVTCLRIFISTGSGNISGRPGPARKIIDNFFSPYDAPWCSYSLVADCRCCCTDSSDGFLSFCGSLSPTKFERYYLFISVYPGIDTERTNAPLAHLCSLVQRMNVSFVAPLPSTATRNKLVASISSQTLPLVLTQLSLG